MQDRVWSVMLCLMEYNKNIATITSTALGLAKSGYQANNCLISPQKHML